MKTNPASRSAFSNSRVSIVFAFRSVGLVLGLAWLSNSVIGMIGMPGTNPVPLISQPLIPDATTPGGPGLTLTVNGTGFLSGSVVNWNGRARATTFVNSSQLTAAILASDIATASTASITVVNPSPGGGTSNVVFFPITIPTSSVSFGTSDYATGISPSWVSVGDFNEDSKLDLAVVNNGSNSVSVLLGNGDGTFQAHVDYGTGSGPSSMAVGDFNGDRKLDLAITNGVASVGNTVSVLLGNGDGTFQPHVDYGTRLGPLSLAVGDFNVDGSLDLAVACYGPAFQTGEASILLGNGDGTFQAHVDYAAGVNPVGVLVGDFNRDNKLDLTVLDNNYPQGVTTLLGNGDGTFQFGFFRDGGPAGPRVGVAEDLNLDGTLDLALASPAIPGYDGMKIQLGNGDGSFRAPVTYPAGTGPASLAGGDLNGDGSQDTAVANNGSNNVSVFIGNGNGTFQPAINYSAGTGPSSIVVADLNADGRLDIAVNSDSNMVSVLLQSPPVNKNCLEPPVGLVSWWSGDRTADDVQGTNPGTLLNGASFTKGMVGPGFLFDGVDDGIRIPDSPSLSHARITVAAWIYQTGNKNTNTRIIGKDDPAVIREYSLGIVGPNNVAQGFVNLLPSAFPIVTGTTIIQLNTWYHIAMTHDGLKLRLYVNGIQEGEVDAVGDIVPTSAPGVIGSDPYGDFFKGSIDEAQIFDRALTDAEILAIYQAGSGGECKPDVFVSSITPSYTTSGHGFRISTSIVIQDVNGVGINDATVQLGVILPSGSALTFPAKTDATGQAKVLFAAADSGLYKFKVRNVSHPVRKYDAALNIETTDTLVIP